VRLNPTAVNGYGYIDPVMYPPLFLYIPAFLRLCGVSMLTAYQLFIFIINLATAVIAYRCTLRLCKDRSTALIMSAAYTLALYRLINIFTRAALGELLAMAFLPLVILGMYAVFFGDEREYKWLVIGMTGVLNSNIPMLEITAVLCLIFALASVRQLRQGARLSALAGSVSFVTLLNAWVIYPLATVAASGLRVIGSTPNPANDAVYPAELFTTFDTATGLSGSLFSAYTGMPLSVGGILGVGALLWLFGRYILKKPFPSESERLEKIAAGSCALAAAALFFASTLFPWTAVGKIPYLGDFLGVVQFPWRYLGAATPLLCIAFALGLHRLAGDRFNRKIVVFAGVAAVMLAASPYIDHYMQDENQWALLSNKFASININYLGGEEYYRQGTNREALSTRPPTVTSSSEQLKVFHYARRYTSLSFDYSASEPPAGAYLEAPLYYYDGYGAALDGKTKLSVYAGMNGVLRILLPDGVSEGHIDVSFHVPAAYRAAELISLLTVLGALGGYIAGKRRKKIAIRQK
jgi:hypothetical protein